LRVAFDASDLWFDDAVRSSEEMKRRVNDFLKRTTGYQISKIPASPAGSTTPGRGNLPQDFDPEMKEIIRAVQPYTMTSADKLHATITATRYIVQHNIPGEVVECGVWRGGSMHAIARTLDGLGDHARELWLYDTFEGMTAPTDPDVRYDGSSAAARLATSDKSKWIWACASLPDVQAGFEQVPYPKDKICYIKGPVEQTVPMQLPDEIAMLRLDTDWYESTAHELNHMYDRLVSGGVLLIDDYGYWLGSRTATDEFLARTNERLLLVRTGTGRIAVKP
jgi:hypothetical protein